MPHYIYESRLLKTMDGPICGVDDAGRGPLAGPVVAAAVILDRKKMPKGLNDSKQLDAETREELYAVTKFANAVGALCATRRGGVPAMPRKNEVEEFLLMS